ncbi:MAG TPA: chorismate-binding protein, partial [Ignavibacteriaceae bacterium]|nr:chorismate-binding protein [Ignavibacteriaceae bacterium]
KTLFTEALAGTAPISDNIEENKNLESILLSSEKEINEHKTVVEHIESVLNNFCSEVVLSNDVGVKKFNTIQHIWTPITGKLQSNYSIFQIVEKLFPTPAVCGAPKESALTYIKKIEEHKRGLYSGIVGWFNLNYNCEFSVAIRSGVISDKKLYAFAGCGIVEASKPETEFAETNLKFNTLLSLFK